MKKGTKFILASAFIAIDLMSWAACIGEDDTEDIEDDSLFSFFDYSDDNSNDNGENYYGYRT